MHTHKVSRINYKQDQLGPTHFVKGAGLTFGSRFQRGTYTALAEFKAVAPAGLVRVRADQKEDDKGFAIPFILAISGAGAESSNFVTIWLGRGVRRCQTGSPKCPSGGLLAKSRALILQRNTRPDIQVSK